MDYITQNTSPASKSSRRAASPFGILRVSFYTHGAHKTGSRAFKDLDVLEAFAGVARIYSNGGVGLINLRIW